MPTSDMTPQQRAVRVYELLLIRPRRTKEIAAELGIGVRAAQKTMANLSVGLPVRNQGGFWFLMPGYELASLFSVYQRMRDVAHTASGDGAKVSVTVSFSEARIIAAVLKRFLPPLPPD